MTQLQDSDPAASPPNKTPFDESPVPPHRVASFGKLLLGVGLGVTITLIGSRLAGNQSPPEEAVPTAETSSPVSAQTVSVVAVQPDTLTERLTVTGTVQAADLLAVTPQISGLKIEAVLVEEGDRVAQGQPLVQLDDTELRMQIEQTQAQIEQAQAQLQQQRANLSQAEATLAEAETNRQRYQALAEQGAISQEALDRRATEAATAQSAVAVAEAAVASAAAAVRSQQAALARLQTQLAYTTVTAPAAGIVAERLTSLGDVSSTITEVVRLIRGGQLELVAEVPQVQLSQVAVGAPVRFSPEAADSALMGTVQEIRPLVDPQTRTAEVIIRLPVSDRLRPGLFLTAEIEVAQRLGLTLPASALQFRPDGSTQVFVVSPEGSAIARTVEVGVRQTPSGSGPARVEIRQGLQPGERVIVAGASYVQDGDQVTVAE